MIFNKHFDFFPTGNNFISLLTRYKPYAMQVDLTLWNGSYFYAYYSSFKLANATRKYAISVSGYKGTAGDSIGTGSIPGEVSNGYRCAEI